MDTLSENPVLDVTKDQLESLRHFYGLDDVTKIKEDIKTIKEWMKKENHLAEASEHMNDIIIERMYYLAKGSLEGTKTRIDRFLTAKSLLPEICSNRSKGEFDSLLTKMQYVIAPKLNPKDLSRVSIMRFVTDDLDDFSVMSNIRYIFMTEDYIQSYDFDFGLTFVLDYKNCPLSLLFKVNPLLVKKAETLYSKGYSLRVKGIYIVNAPSFVDKLISFLKQTMSEKVAGRIKVYQTYEDLHKDVAKEILPKDYGGDQPSMEVMSEKMKGVFASEEAQKIIANAEKLVSDESKRMSSKFNEEYLGMAGSFRVLSVD